MLNNFKANRSAHMRFVAMAVVYYVFLMLVIFGLVTLAYCFLKSHGYAAGSWFFERYNEFMELKKIWRIE